LEVLVRERAGHRGGITNSLPLHIKPDRSYKSEARPMSFVVRDFNRQSYQIVSRETLWYDPGRAAKGSVCGFVLGARGARI
jgi:hypothetical protein